MSTNTPRKKSSVKRIVILSILAVFLIAGVFLYINFNRLLTEALIRSFNSSIVSDVYELKFEKLRVNIFEGSIRISDVVIQPREKPLRSYPYINSSFRLTTDRIALVNVELFTLLRSSALKVERISITKPDVEVVFNDLKPVMIPFKDSTAVTGQTEATTKKPIDFGLHEFQLIDAGFHVTNLAKEREFRISNLSISLHDLRIDQLTGKDLVSFQHAKLSVGEFDGRLRNGGIRRVKFVDHTMEMDSLRVEHTVDTLMFRFDDFKAAVSKLDMQTRDSLFHFTLESFNLSYKEKSVKLRDLSFTPNISDADMQKRYTYQHTSVSATVGALDLNQLNFDSLIYSRSIYVDEVLVDKPAVSIFKDNTKPMDMNKFPPYFGQQIRGIKIPLLVKRVKLTNVELVNVERKKDSSYAKVRIQRGTVVARNITNRSKNPMTLTADAYVENKVHVHVVLGFDYSRPQFTISGKLEKFELPELNPVIQAYTPGKITSGTADSIKFSGTIYQTNSVGTMEFIYHNLEVDLELHNKAKWKSSVIAFAANSALHSSNPGSAKLPPRIVTYRVDRDVHKGFVNIIIKSALTGIKETLFMSKENRKQYKEAKKKRKEEGKE